MVKGKGTVAYKSTEMIQLKGNIVSRDLLNETEQKAVMYIASQVKQDSKAGDEYLFEYRKFAEIAGLEINGRLYKDIKDMIYGLQAKRVMFRDENAKGDKSATMIVSPSYYDNGVIQYEVDKNLLPHFKAFSAGFTMIDVTDYMRIRGKHPLSLYELMLSWATKGRVEYTIEELRQKLSISDDAYPRNNDFVKQIRLAIEEINSKSQKIQVEAEGFTGSRKNKIEKFIFKITKMKTPNLTPEEKLEVETGQTTIYDTMSEQAATTTTAVQNKKPSHKCPKCETGKVVLKNGKNGEFWGCTNQRLTGCNYASDDSPEIEAEKRAVEEKKKERSKPKADCEKCKGMGYRPVYDENGEDMNTVCHCECWS